MARLTDEEIMLAGKLWQHKPHIHYLENHTVESLSSYFDELKNHAVVEIGPGENPITSHVPCGEYIPAHGHFPMDGLSVLRRQPDKSAVIVSFGVFDDSILGPDANGDINDRYIRELAEEVRRVMNPFSIIIGSNAQEYLGTPDVSDWERFGGVYLLKNENRKRSA